MEKEAQKTPEIKYKIPKDAREEFWEWLELNNLSIGTQLGYYRIALRLMISNKEKYSLSKEKIQAFLGKKTNSFYQGSIRKFLFFLSERYDINLGKFTYPKIQPCKKVTIPLTREEVKLLIDSMPNQEPFYKFGLLTEFIGKCGVRVTEGVSLRIRDIDFDSWFQDETKNGRIILKQTKGDYQRVLPVSPDMMNKLAKQCTDSNKPGCSRPKKDYVFDFDFDRTMQRYERKYNKFKDVKDTNVRIYPPQSRERKYIEKSVKYFRKTLSIISKKVLKKNVNPHLFRHSVATYLDSKDIRLPIIQRILGHKGISTTARYIHPSEKALEEAIID